jgi:chromosome segregation ATPase
MKVLFFGGAALVATMAVFGGIRAGQEATPVVVAESNRLVRRVTQADVVAELTDKVAALAKRVADGDELRDTLLATVEKLTTERGDLQVQLSEATKELEKEMQQRKAAAAAAAELRQKATMLALELNEARDQLAVE